MKLLILILAAFALTVINAWHQLEQRRQLPPGMVHQAAAPIARGHPDHLFSPCPLAPRNLPGPRKRIA